MININQNSYFGVIVTFDLEVRVGGIFPLTSSKMRRPNSSYKIGLPYFDTEEQQKRVVGNYNDNNDQKKNTFHTGLTILPHGP